MNINYDIHIHTHLSPCASREASAQGYIDKSVALGLNTIGFADHMWDNGKGFGIASYGRHDQNFPKIIKIREELASCTVPDGVRVLVGCETDFTSDSTLGISREVASQLDFVLAPPSHTHFPEVMPQELTNDIPEMAQFVYNTFLRLISHPDADIITSVAHPFASSLVGSDEGDAALLRHITDDQYRRAFRQAADMGIGIEINACVVRLSLQRDKNPEDIKSNEYYRMFSLAKDCGCKFTFGSDAHAHGSCEYLDYAARMADAIGLTDEHILLI